MFGQSLLSAFGSTACTTNNPNYPITNLAYYKMSNASDSGEGSGYIGQGGIFNGSSSKISIPSSFGIGNIASYSVSLWAKSNSNTSQVWIGGKTTRITNNHNFTIGQYSTSGQIRVFCGSDTNDWILSQTSSVFYDGLWHNYTFVKNGTNGYFYIDGVLFDSSNVFDSSTTLDPSGDEYIAANWNGAVDFNGSIDQVRIFPTALSSSNVALLYAETSATSSTLNYPVTATALYEFSGNANSTSSSAYNGTATNVEYAYNGTATNVNFNVAGKFGNAGEFNGTSSYISLPTGQFNYSNFTISSWVLITSTPSAQGCILSTYMYVGGGPSKGYLFRVNTNMTVNFSGYYDDSGNSNNFNTTQTVPLNTWTHLAVTYNSTGNIIIYINGTSAATQATASNPVRYETNNNTTIGAMDYSSSTPVEQFFVGQIDQIRIFSSALNATQVTQLYEEIQCVPTIVPSDNFNAVLYNGDSVNASQSSTSVTTVGFQPDFTWIKARDNGSNNHALTDSVRGTGSGNGLSSNTAGAQGQYSAAYGYLSAFSTDGFTVTGGTTSSGFVNNENTTYVAWSWKAGGAPTATNSGGQTPTSGSKMVDGVASTADFATSTSYPLRQSVNSSTGFSITTITKSSSGIPLEVPHGLNSPPELIMLKTTDSSDDWNQWQTAIGTGAYLSTSRNSGSDGATASSGYGFTVVNNDIIRNQWTTPIRTWVCYAWHSVAGYSKMGSYNGSNSPISIITGFTPAFLMVKRTNATSDWLIIDSARATGSGADALYPNSAAAESSNWNTSFDSNGFTISSNEAWLSVSGGEYIFMAFAE